MEIVHRVEAHGITIIGVNDGFDSTQPTVWDMMVQVYRNQRNTVEQ